MTDSLPRLLLQLSEAGEPAILGGRQAKPHFSPAFDRLLQRGILIEEAPVTEWSVCPDCECGLDWRPIEQFNGRHIALCPIDQRSNLVLDADDLRSFRVDPAALVREIAAVSGFGTMSSEVARAVWHLGTAPNRRAVFLALTRSAVLETGLLPLVRSIAQASPVTFLTPELSAADRAQLLSAGLHVASTVDFLSAKGVAFALCLDQPIPASVVEPTLILNKGKLAMTFNGHDAPLPQRAFDLLWLLAEAIVSGGGMVSRPQIEQHLWGKQVVSKTAAADAIRDLRARLAATPGEKKRGSLIETRNRQGYILQLPANAIQIIN
ncbi:MAG: winged helix-turn-helix domain-containing protein [Rhizobiales bacterium]|nr:winged helix-turn-helix domain-containing protein [Hyphomicrobiales bacterium]